MAIVKLNVSAYEALLNYKEEYIENKKTIDKLLRKIEVLEQENEKLQTSASMMIEKRTLVLHSNAKYTIKYKENIINQLMILLGVSSEHLNINTIEIDETQLVDALFNVQISPSEVKRDYNVFYDLSGYEDNKLIDSELRKDLEYQAGLSTELISINNELKEIISNKNQDIRLLLTELIKVKNEITQMENNNNKLNDIYNLLKNGYSLWNKQYLLDNVMRLVGIKKN